MYDPSIWRDYFVMVGGGAAALTGLVFVAMTLHLEDIVHHPVQRHRARTILTGLTAVFLRCGLVLMGGQTRQAVAVELISVLVVVEESSTEVLRTLSSPPTPVCCSELPAASPACLRSRLARRSCSLERRGAFTWW